VFSAVGGRETLNYETPTERFDACVASTH
jgi:hypothetical protein